MTTLPERESAFEAKFAHDEETRFLAKARRDKLFAGWMADRLRLDGSARTVLVTSVLAVGNNSQHDDLLLELAERLVTSQGETLSRTDLNAALADCAAQAHRQLAGIPTAP